MSSQQKLKFYWRDKNPMVNADLYSRVGIKYSNLPGNCIGIVVMGNDFINSLYFKNKAWKEAIKSGAKLINKKYSENYFNKIKVFKKNYARFILKTKSLNYSKIPDEKLIELLKKLWDLQLLGHAFYWGSQAEPLTEVEKKLKNILFEFYPKVEFDRIMELIIAITKNDKAQEQEIAWFKILSNKSLTKKKFLEHSWNFPFLFRNTFDIKTAFNYFKNKFKDDKRKINELRDEIKKLEQKRKELINKQTEIFRRIGKEGEYLAKIFQKSAIERMELKYIWAGVEEFTFNNLYREVAKRIREDFINMIYYYRQDEIIKAIKNKIKLPKIEIEKRKKYYFFDVINKKVVFYSGDEAIKYVKKHYPELVENIQENSVKGTVACLGKATGKAVIMLNEDFLSLEKWNKEFKKGQILIAGMTQPSMITLMRRAGAIVTDEGGLTSHAAIISREFGTPCIVGTHKATQIFKDGDLLEVDAINGIVKKINK